MLLASFMAFMSRRRNRAETEGTAEDAAEGSVNILRYLDPACIQLELQSRPSEAPVDESPAHHERRLVSDKERILQELADVLDRSGKIVNPTKFYKDLVNRERKASTAIVPKIAIPHVRSMQAREFLIGFARSREGLPFASVDNEPTHLFFMLASPPYEDRLYLRVYREFAEMIRHDWIVDSFMDAENEQEVINILRGYVAQ